MGAVESTETSGFQRVGYHVLQVHPNSPGESAGLTSYFDFIVAVEGIVLDKEDARFVSALKDNVGKPLKLSVYNRKTDLIRETFLTPNPNWGGSGLAGISIRFCTFEQATENVWHILDIYHNSPASQAGLQPHTDYIVGSPELLLSDSEDFFTMVELFEKKGKTLPLYVYSSNTDSIRLVQLNPNRNWGGNNSCLGCDIGTGYLHRIPLTRNVLPVTQQLTNLNVQYPSPPGQVTLTAPMSPVSLPQKTTESEMAPFYSPQANFTAAQYTPIPTTPIPPHATVIPESPAPAPEATTTTTEAVEPPKEETQPVQEEPKP